MAKRNAVISAPVQTAEQIRALFEANLRVGQKVHLRFNFTETNHTSGEKWFAPQGTRAKIEFIEPFSSGTLYNVVFTAARTVDGEEKPRPLCRPLSVDQLCPKEEALHASVKEAQIG